MLTKIKTMELESLFSTGSQLQSILNHRFWRLSVACGLRYWPRKIGYDFESSLALCDVLNLNRLQSYTGAFLNQSAKFSTRSEQTRREKVHVFVLTTCGFRIQPHYLGESCPGFFLIMMDPLISVLLLLACFWSSPSTLKSICDKVYICCLEC